MLAAALVLSAAAWLVLDARRDRTPADLSRHPDPSPSSTAACVRFAAALPDSLGRLDRRRVVPIRPGFAAYGDPAVEIRCGVPASGAFRPGDPLIAVNDIAWYADESQPGGVDFSLPRSVLNISVWIPARYRADLLSALTDAVRVAQPI